MPFLIPSVAAIGGQWAAGMNRVMLRTSAPHADYAQATAGLRWLIGPVVMALAVPLARQRPLRLAMTRPLALATGLNAVLTDGVMAGVSTLVG